MVDLLALLVLSGITGGESHDLAEVIFLGMRVDVAIENRQA